MARQTVATHHDVRHGIDSRITLARVLPPTIAAAAAVVLAARRRRRRHVVVVIGDVGRLDLPITLAQLFDMSVLWSRLDAPIVSLDSTPRQSLTLRQSVASSRASRSVEHTPHRSIHACTHARARARKCIRACAHVHALACICTIQVCMHIQKCMHMRAHTRTHTAGTRKRVLLGSIGRCHSCMVPMTRPF